MRGINLLVYDHAIFVNSKIDSWALIYLVLKIIAETTSTVDSVRCSDKSQVVGYTINMLKKYLYHIVIQ